MKTQLALTFCILISLHTSAVNAKSSFVFIVADDNSLQAGGQAGYREMFADVLVELRAKHVSSVALKFFFFDLDSAQDGRLATEMSKTATLPAE